jgi:hypothetical protein
LAAILEALCQMTTTKLTDIIPLSGMVEQARGASSSSEPRFRQRGEAGVSDDNKQNSVSGGTSTVGETLYFPMLVGHMLHQTEMELIGRSHFWTFRDILDRLLTIAGLPLRYALGSVSMRLCIQKMNMPNSPDYSVFFFNKTRCRNRLLVPIITQCLCFCREMLSVF